MLKWHEIKKQVWALALMLIVCHQVSAVSVSVYTAKKIALNFYKTSINYSHTHDELEADLKYTQTGADNTVTFYVFDINPAHGFVIVSASDNVMPVIAYSTEAYFNTGFENTGLSNWMESRSAEISYIIQNNLPADDRVNELWADYRQGIKPAALKNAGVPPLCATTWDQENYYAPPYLYNLLCPYNNYDHQRCLTGCVATAMAQIMKYWNYPVHGTGTYSYEDNQVHGFSNNYGTLSANFGNTYYKWNEMPNTLNPSCSDDDDSAVSLLMYHCGIAVATDYGDDNQNGSGAFMLQSDAGTGQPCAESAFKTYFGYNSNTLQGVKKSNYSSSAWISLIESELNAGRPLEYQGSDPTYGGHTWVCDGYDQNDNLHMNWGWGGMDNGYYSISNLNALSYNFGHNNEALIGIQPAVSVQVTASAANPVICYGHSTTLTAQGPSNATYSWHPNAGLSCSTCASTNASPYYTTTYTVTVDSASFTGTASAIVNVDYIDVDIDTVNNVSDYNLANGSIVLSVTDGIEPYSFLWSNGKTTPAISGLAQGDYTVTVTDSLGCQQTASALVSVVTGVNNPAPVFSFNIYPNPVKTEMIIQLENSVGETTLIFKNVLGQQLFTKQLTSRETQINLSPFANGLYMAELHQGEKMVVRQIVLNK